MILIKHVRCKNFLSYGNAYTELSLNSHKATLVRGKNGHGKSAWMDLILYALYGKPYRDITKPQLINSINGGQMIAEIDFSINGNDYKVIRGQKPAVFDIFCNGQLIEQSAASRDYQDFLEKQILKVSEKTFKQIAVLGSASYVPFMQLPAGQRRELIESILDIEIFSKMSALLKERINSTKDEYSGIGHKLEVKKTEATAQQKLIKVMQANNSNRVAELEVERSTYEKELLLKEQILEEIKTTIDNLVANEVVFDNESYANVSEKMDDNRKEITKLQKRLSTLAKMDMCPTCMQEVTDGHIHSVEVDINKTVEDIEQNQRLLQKEFDELSIVRKQSSEWFSLYQSELTKQRSVQSEVDALRKNITKIDSSIKSILSNTDDIETEQNKLKKIAEEGTRLIERKNQLSEEKHIQDVAAQLLKDTGIKTAIVKEYLPVLNQLINKYLAMFDFFVDFTLDESFSEVIKSRGRDDFSYSSFSEGEKRRIDFAILMAFRQLAALKNSAKTNVLIFDEIVDGAFDLEARSQFNDLISTIPNSNVIVISHADANTEAYDRVLQVEKRGDFSEYFIVE